MVRGNSNMHFYNETTGNLQPPTDLDTLTQKNRSEALQTDFILQAKAIYVRLIKEKLPNISWTNKASNYNKLYLITFHKPLQ